ncbi:TrmH family RNA methyltransferase [Paenibacillus thalictri]|uniref:RNA methyltransferase n=1 Tax=Paenibacillus thalictri TaxID=2527873 RepID=A0A4Q9DLY2_9BACL|nr:RNA methyltransferase [Paenibacillus thalictri]TBL76295.1 RNA methyltransferase [Paenibacillus thalictri]
MDKLIVSVQNTRVKEWAQLLDKKGRDKQNKFIVEGVHLVQEALTSGAVVESVVYCADRAISREIENLLSYDIEKIGVSEEVLARCTDAKTPQNIFAVVRKLHWNTGHLKGIGNDLVVVLDGVRDPGNVGTIIRSADAVGASAIVLGKGTADLYNPKTVRSTMGSMFKLPIVEGDLQELLPQAASGGKRIAAASLRESKSLYEYDFRQPTWLIVGNEGQGINPQIEELAAERISIPMPGGAESLNVAMATTVLLFEAMRQRRG